MAKCNTTVLVDLLFLYYDFIVSKTQCTMEQCSRKKEAKRLEKKIKKTKASIIVSLEIFIARITEDIKERKLWLSTDSTQRIHPHFSKTYSSRLSIERSDKSFDNKLLDLEQKVDRMGLSSQSIELINTLKIYYETSLEQELDQLRSDYEAFMRTSPKMIGLSEEQMIKVKADHDMLIDKTIDKSNRLLRLEIEKIIEDNKLKKQLQRKKSSNEILERDISSEFKKETTKRYVQAREIVNVKLEKEMKVFDESVVPSLLKKGIDQDRLSDIRKEHMEGLQKEFDLELRKENTKISREYRMHVALQLEKSSNSSEERILNMISIYVDKMKQNYEYQRVISSPDWEETLLSVDSAFSECKSDWNIFTDLLVSYWNCYIFGKTMLGEIVEEEKRQEYDRLVRLYAFLNKEKKTEPVHENDLIIEKLRETRNALIVEIKELDEIIKKVVNDEKISRQVIKTRKPSKKQEDKNRKRDILREAAKASRDGNTPQEDLDKMIGLYISMEQSRKSIPQAPPELFDENNRGKKRIYNY